jgi:hypothetical protein
MTRKLLALLAGVVLTTTLALAGCSQAEPTDELMMEEGSMMEEGTMEETPVAEEGTEEEAPVAEEGTEEAPAADAETPAAE